MEIPSLGLRARGTISKWEFSIPVVFWVILGGGLGCGGHQGITLCAVPKSKLGNYQTEKFNTKIDQRAQIVSETLRHFPKRLGFKQLLAPPLHLLQLPSTSCSSQHRDELESELMEAPSIPSAPHQGNNSQLHWSTSTLGTPLSH